MKDEDENASVVVALCNRIWLISFAGSVAGREGGRARASIRARADVHGFPQAAIKACRRARCALGVRGSSARGRLVLAGRTRVTKVAGPVVEPEVLHRVVGTFRVAAVRTAGALVGGRTIARQARGVARSALRVGSRAARRYLELIAATDSARNA